MRKPHLTGRGSVAASLLLTASLLLAPSSTAAQDCSANLEPRLDTEEPEGSLTNLQYKVDVSVEVNCAHVTYDLILDILLPNGQTKKVRKPRVVKLSDGSLTDTVRYQLGEGSTVTDFEARLVECRHCEMGN